MSHGKYKKALLQFLADNMDYADYMKGIDNLSEDQLIVLVEKAIHSAIDRFFKSKEYKPATKYLDLYLMMFWWLQKNKDLNGTMKCDKLFDMMTGKVDMSARAKMSRVTINNLVSRELPIDTKGFYPKVA